MMRVRRYRLLLPALVCGVLFPVAEAQEVVLAEARAPSTAMRLHPEQGAGFGEQTPHYVRLDAAALRNAVSAAARGVPTSIAIELAPGRSIQSESVWTEERGAQRLTWSGAVDGDPLGHLLLTVEGRAVSGRVAVGGQTYEIGYAGEGRQVVYEVEPATPESYCAAKEQTVEGLPRSSFAEAPRSPARHGAIDTVRVLIAYTTDVRERLGEEGLTAFLQANIDSANDVLVRTEVAGRLVLGFAGEVAPLDPEHDLSSFETLRALREGVFSEVPNWRYEHSTPVVSLLTERFDHCGIAFIPGSLREDTIGASLFNIVRRNCALGGYSFLHEVGHNFGLLHDPYVNLGNGPFAFSHGYINLASEPGEAFRTVMAYSAQCEDADIECPRVPYFSNPSLTLDAHPLGQVGVSDAARALGLSVPFIAGLTWIGPEPPAPPDFYVTIQEDELLTLTPPLDTPTEIHHATRPEHGTATWDGESLFYQPDQDYYGSDSFSYFVGNSVFGPFASGTVYIEIESAVDPPYESSITSPYQGYVLDLDAGPWFDVEWSALRAPEGDEVLEATWEFGFSYYRDLRLQIPAGDTTALRVATAQLEELLASGGVPSGGGVEAYHRVNVSNGVGTSYGPSRTLYVQRFDVAEEEEEEEEVEATTLYYATLRAAYPNPASDTFTLEVGVPFEQEARVAFYNVTGRAVHIQRPALSNGFNTLEFDLGGLPAGVYFYRVEVAGATFRGRVVVL